MNANADQNPEGLAGVPENRGTDQTPETPIIGPRKAGTRSLIIVIFIFVVVVLILVIEIVIFVVEVILVVEVVFVFEVIEVVVQIFVLQIVNFFVFELVVFVAKLVSPFGTFIIIGHARRDRRMRWSRKPTGQRVFFVEHNFGHRCKPQKLGHRKRDKRQHVQQCRPATSTLAGMYGNSTGLGCPTG